MRTMDESGVPFVLVFNQNSNDFLWILDEDRKEANQISNIKYQNFELEKRTSFAFYNDEKNNRKVLIGVYAENIKRNNYFDGPFDQLADNEIEKRNKESEKMRKRESEEAKNHKSSSSSEAASREVTIADGILNFKKYIELTYPYIRGRIDEYGHLLGRDGKVLTTRVAITPYYIYESLSDLEDFIGKCTKLKGEERILGCLIHDDKKG